jgi:hypothetical protein
MIDNLVTAINWHGGTTVNIPSGWTGKKVRDTVWARRNGNSLELMTRQGSASWNSLTALAFTNVTGSSSQSWASGAGGAWGYLLNINGTAWPSAWAIYNYGLFSPNKPIAGVVADGDVVNIRSGKTLKIINNSASAATIVQFATGTASAYTRFKFDDSTIWSDGTNPVFTIDRVVSYGAATVWIQAGTTNYSTIEAPCDPANDYFGLVLKTTSGLMLGLGLHGNRFITGIHFIGSTTAANIGFINSNTAAGGYVVGTKLRFTHNADTPVSVLDYGGSQGTLKLVDSESLGGSLSTAHSGLFSLAGQYFNVVGEALRFSGFVVGSKLLKGATEYRSMASFKNVDLENVSAWGTGAIGSTTATALNVEIVNALTNFTEDRRMVLDSRKGFAEWNPSRSFPVLNAVLPNGDGWAIRAIASVTAGQTTLHWPFALPSITKRNTLEADQRTFTLHFCVHDGITLTARKVWAEVSYTDTNGDVVLLSSFDMGGASLTSDSGVTWSSESGGKVTYDDGGVLSFNKYKIELTTPTDQDLEADTDVTLTVFLAYQASTTSNMLFIDPDFEIA